MAKTKRIVAKTTQFDCGEFEEVEIMPIADLHIGDKGMDEKLLDKVCEWVNEYEHRYVVIAGDIFNAGLKDSVSTPYNEVMNLQQALNYFKGFVGKLGVHNVIATVRGNHDNRVVKSVGLDPVAVACDLNGIQYCGSEGYINLKVGDWHWNRDRKRCPINYVMFLSHGSGGGRLVGSKVNGMMKANNIVVADLFVQGHTHTPVIVPNVIYTPDNQGVNILAKDQLFVTTCGFLSRDGYAKDFGYAAVSQKFPIIKLSGRDKRIEAELKELR